jgi:hypothetical protein
VPARPPSAGPRGLTVYGFSTQLIAGRQTVPVGGQPAEHGARQRSQDSHDQPKRRRHVDHPGRCLQAGADTGGQLMRANGERRLGKATVIRVRTWPGRTNRTRAPLPRTVSWSPRA